VVDLGAGEKMTASQFLQMFLFSPQQQYDYVGKLSGGERQRLHLCTVLMRSPNFLILDEPTNDLDIPTLNILEDYLRNFRGCLIVISHDRYFMDKVVDHLFVFHGDGHIQDFPGNYTQYRLEQGTKTKEPRANTTENKTEKIKTEQKRRLSFKEKKELEQLNLLLPQLEAEKAQLESILASGTASADEITTTSQRYQQLLEELDTAEMRWLELSEFAE
jgi:ATP-binding cassette subfamily F protein uup